MIKIGKSIFNRERLTDAVLKRRSDVFGKIYENLYNDTPVDTGRARDGWKMRFRDGQPDYIYNNVGYIIYLNEGHSQQAPPMFIEAAVAEALNS